MDEENNNLPEEQPAKNIAGEKTPIDKTAIPETEVIAPEQPETTNLSSEALPAGKAGSAKKDVKQQTTEMEVHHHPHPAHGKKNWKTYFWEFLMLFLAVFCGFLAEYQLEHKIEKERGVQYLHSLHIDLRTDIDQCNISIAELTAQTTVLLNMNDCFETLKKDIKATGCLNELIFNSLGFKDFIYTDRTIQQLKNAGGLRLIQNKELADSIIAYDAMVREMHIHQVVLEELQQICRDAHNNMIDYEHMDEMMNDKVNTGGLFLLSEDTGALNKYFNAINQFKRGLDSQLNWMKLIKEKANRLLALLEKNGIT